MNCDETEYIVLTSGHLYKFQSFVFKADIRERSNFSISGGRSAKQNTIFLHCTYPNIRKCLASSERKKKSAKE